MDESKVRTVTEWPKPQSIKEMQRFLEFAIFYCRTTYLDDKSENESAAMEPHCQPRILMLESLTLLLSPYQPYSVSQIPDYRL